MTDEEIDFSDCPEITPEMLKSASVRRGRKSNSQKETITLEIDRDILQWLKTKEESYQSYINTLLRDCMEDKK